MNVSEGVAMRALERIHKTRSATEDAAVGLLAALAEHFLDGGRVEHGEWALRRAELTLAAGAYAPSADIELLERVKRRRP